MFDANGRLIPDKALDPVSYLVYETDRQGRVQEKIRDKLEVVSVRVGKVETKSSIFGAVGGAVTCVGIMLASMIKGRGH